jgi:integrase
MIRALRDNKESFVSHANHQLWRLAMPKDITGYVSFDKKADKYFFRFQYTDERGKRRQIRRLCTSESNAKSELRKAINKHEAAGGDEHIHAGERMKFKELAERYEKSKVFAAQYKSNRKVAGLRSHKTVKLFLDVLKAEFGERLINQIKPSHIEQYKLKRINTPTKNGTERAISSVNRELMIFRVCLNFAVREGFLQTNPFTKCSVISTADETARTRTLSFDEEKRLLAALEYRNKQNVQTIVHIKPVVVAAIDLGARRGELFKLLWKDIDFENRIAHIRAENTKTQTARFVGLTDRLHEILSKLWSKSPKQLEMRVFGITNNISKAWKTALRVAEIEDLHFHDLRHTFASRVIASGVHTTIAMHLTGHKQLSTFQRYNNVSVESARQAANKLHEFNSRI